MPHILLIETATDVCSVAITDGKTVISSRHSTEPRSQASGLAPMIQDALGQASLDIKDIAAVAVSAGPGSYTGLRVGVSTAKGLCFGAGIPLIGIGTLDVIARGAAGSVTDPDTLIVPMIDARRMEVYTARFDSSARRISGTEAVVLEPETFAAELEARSRVIFTGDGAAKYESILADRLRDKAVFIPSYPDAAHMAEAAFQAYEEKKFEDTAYFEPFYLKEFIAADPSRKIEAVLHPDRL
ncbi:MAG TPA: tRNA (adenosine(37)-N6)-threonylcarbamoyltransferase complex dimerization subunit type 1 TsaB [Candidatus Coprenecus stercoravium]|uniref:tRNA (Adenosine(37)-N6)-threonylcarbamoyltransferase complex dimerization subunit type 1 TsaB n=1 Tax=Candidatus Coprenecus stercoravium TaxID=2840735 RepID=A0A9D2GS96_9BACT|nr:tRNA (adenosine(37)-N6)-threonylcarbamoyltransferase complex dimerization subunit type 1 TsaB [Candidatus Coprenecus stercoravium]